MQFLIEKLLLLGQIFESEIFINLEALKSPEAKIISL